MNLASIAVGEALLILKILFLLLLYLFIWRIVRTASRDLRLPQESFVLSPDVPAGEVALAQELVTLTVGGKRRELTSRRVVIGRSKDCDVQLADPNASRRHAELRQEGSAYWLIDLDSTNGSSVNGHRTARAKLDSGDVITIGSTELLFERRLVE